MLLQQTQINQGKDQLAEAGMSDNLIIPVLGF